MRCQRQKKISAETYILCHVDSSHPFRNYFLLKLICHLCMYIYHTNPNPNPNGTGTGCFGQVSASRDRKEDKQQKCSRV